MSSESQTKEFSSRSPASSLKLPTDPDTPTPKTTPTLLLYNEVILQPKRTTRSSIISETSNSFYLLPFPQGNNFHDSPINKCHHYKVLREMNPSWDSWFFSCRGTSGAGRRVQDRTRSNQALPDINPRRFVTKTPQLLPLLMSQSTFWFPSGQEMHTANTWRTAEQERLKPSLQTQGWEKLSE